MSGLAKGVEQSKAMVSKAVEGVAGDMLISPQENLSGVVSAITGALSQLNGQHGDIVIPM